jgi:hypothetical protein
MLFGSALQDIDRLCGSEAVRRAMRDNDERRRRQALSELDKQSPLRCLVQRAGRRAPSEDRYA